MANVTYEDFLYDLQANNSIPLVADLFPDEDQIFEVDLNTRTINIPQFLSVQYDHNAEVVYFKIPRYFEGVDLATTTCVIQFINASGDAGIYCVPFYDLTHFDIDKKGRQTPMLLFPWSLGGLATIVPGAIKFSIRFYVINANTKKFEFNLNTQVATGNILYGMNLPVDAANQFRLDASVTEQIYASMREMSAASATYWYDIDETDSGPGNVIPVYPGYDYDVVSDDTIDSFFN